MGWGKGRYYTRSKKVNGRVVREYVGAGHLGELAAELDTPARHQRRVEREAAAAEQTELGALDEPLGELHDLAELVARAALAAAGYRQHKRGEWRMRREQTTATE